MDSLSPEALTYLASSSEGGGGLNGLIIAVVVVAVVVGFVYKYLSEKKRRGELEEEAEQLGFSFDGAHNHQMAKDLSMLRGLQHGYNRYCFNVMSGAYQEQQVLLFDYHYETTSTDGSGHTQTQHFYFSVTSLTLPRPLPGIRITPENFFDKIEAAVGFTGITFESAEFSQKYKVTSPDKKYAYDFCNAQMMQHLIEQAQRLHIEQGDTTLAVIYRGETKPDSVRQHLDQLFAVRQLLPNYLFEG